MNKLNIVIFVIMLTAFLVILEHRVTVLERQVADMDQLLEHRDRSPFQGRLERIDRIEEVRK